MCICFFYRKTTNFTTHVGITTPSTTIGGGDGFDTVKDQTVRTKTLTIVAYTHNVPISQMKKPEKFKGGDFKRSKEKMMFYLTAMNLVRFIKESAPVEARTIQTCTLLQLYTLGNNRTTLDYLDDALYNVYFTKGSAKALLESLEKKYKVNDANVSKFAVANFHEFMMVNIRALWSKLKSSRCCLISLSRKGTL